LIHLNSMNLLLIKNLYRLFLIGFFLGSCASVEKYNQQVTAQHSPRKLRKDADYAYKKLQELHPDLYWYINKEDLDQKFKTLKGNLQKPLSGKEFYANLSPIIASIKQGHTSIYPPRKKKTKDEKKSKIKKKNPFKSIRLQRIDNKLYIVKKFEKDSTLLEGSEVLRVENEKIEDLLTSFQQLTTSDGFNKTFVPQFTGTYFGMFYAFTHKRKDSILLTLKHNDSIYHRYLYATSNENVINKKIKKDSLKHKRSKIEKKHSKKERKTKWNWEYKYGYNKYSKEKTRDFKFLTPDSSHTVSYMKIRGFIEGGYKKFYKESFAQIDSAQSENLILDLRGNLGGSLTEIDHLYSYLSEKEYLFISEANMTKSRNFLYPLMHSKSWLTKTITTLLYPVLIVYQGMKVKKIKGKPNFQFKTSKLKKPKTDNYKGNIYVLINGTSFSASSVISTHLKATNRAIFVGEETGGAYNGTVAGMFANIELPNSKIRMRIGLMNLKTPYTIEPDGFGVKPDVSIKTTRFDKDEQLDWVLSDILKN